MVTPTYFPIIGGTEEVIYNLTKTLTEMGHSVTLIAPDFGGTSQTRVEHLYGSELRFPFIETKGLMLATQNSSCFRTAIRAHRRENFEVIHQFHVVPLGIACLSLRRILHKPLVTSLMGWDTYDPDPNAFYRVSRPIASMVMNSSDTVTSPSNDVAQRAHASGCWRNIDVIPHGVDPDHFDAGTLKKGSNDLRERLGFHSDEIMILSVNRLVERKDVGTMIEAAPRILRKCAKTKFVVVGEGPEQDSLLRASRERGVPSSFKFVGRVPAREMPFYYVAADIFVMTSTYEHFGVAVLEAMAAQKPVIASDVGALPEIVLDNRTGLLFRPRDSAQLADLVITLIQDEPRRREMGAVGRERVKALYSWRKIARLYSDIYERLPEL